MWVVSIFSSLCKKTSPFPKMSNCFFKGFPNLPSLVATKRSLVSVVITNCCKRCDEITLRSQTLGWKQHIYIFISSFICWLSKHPLSSIGWDQRKPYYSHKLAQMRVSLETSIHQEGRTGGLRGQIWGFLLMCSLLSVLPAIDGSSRASSLQQLQIGMYETRK